MTGGHEQVGASSAEAQEAAAAAAFAGLSVAAASPAPAPYGQQQQLLQSPQVPWSPPQQQQHADVPWLGGAGRPPALSVHADQGQSLHDAAGYESVHDLAPSPVVGDLDAAMERGGRPLSPVPLNHYLQNMISPRSRAEYDEFNRFHFSKLRQLGRLGNKRTVTPKVRGTGRAAPCWPCVCALPLSHNCSTLLPPPGWRGPHEPVRGV